MKLIICLGPCCAGKTTWCKKYLKDNPDAVRFGLDDFKLLLRGDLSNDILDDQFILLSYDLIAKLLLIYKHVVVDGYFFSVRKLKLLTGLTKDHEIRLFDLSYRESLVRNIVRKKKTGVTIRVDELERFYKKYTNFIESSEFKNYARTIKLKMNENDHNES